jgi:hypothetical protein
MFFPYYIIPLDLCPTLLTFTICTIVKNRCFPFHDEYSHYQHNNDPKLIFCIMPKMVQKASFMKQKATKKGLSTNKPNHMTVERKNIQVRGVNLTYGRWSWSAVVERCVRVQVQSDYLQACHNLTESVALRKRLLSGVIISSLHNWSAQHSH